MSRYLAFIAVALTLLLTAISSTTIAVAFPVLTSSFGASIVLAGWVLSINQLVSTAAMPLAGKAADIFGRKLVFLVCLLLFTIGSLLSALAPNIWFLIAARFIQGIGSGGFLPVATGIVADEFPKSRQQVIGLFTSIFPIGQIIGPNIGGWIVDAFGWRSVFWLNVPLGIVVLVISAYLLRPGRREKGEIDLIGAGLFTGSLFAIIIALSGMDDPTPLSLAFSGALFIAGILLLVAFLRHERRAKNPIIDLEVLRGRPFMAANIYNFILGACVIGVMSFAPLYATSVYGMSTLQSGFILTPRSIGMLVASTVTSIFLLRWGYRWPMIIGAISILLSLFLLGVESPGVNLFGFQIGSLAIIIVVMLLAGVGMGITAPAANNACIELMPNRIATITGVRGMFRQAGGAVTIAITSLLLDNLRSVAYGFTVAFFGLAVVMLLITPLIFMMPRGPETPKKG